MSISQRHLLFLTSSFGQVFLNSRPPVRHFESKNRMRDEQRHQVREDESGDDSGDDRGGAEHSGHRGVLGLHRPVAD